jgi:hypothetical protein
MSQPIRVYLPATMSGLATLRRAGSLAATGAYAVTPALRDQLGDADEEELSYAAYRLAAGASLSLLRADSAAPRRRVVVSADVPARPAAGGDPGSVLLTGPVPVASVAAIHLDGAGAEPAVAAALDAPGEDAGASAVDELAEHELEWYDVSELSQLVA